MTTKEIQSVLQRWLYDKSNIYQCLNYAKSGYFEADILAMTASMVITEIEVKVSISDYRADFKKTAKHYRLINRKGYEPHTKIPNKFYYACPDGLIKEVPEYAGLIWVNSEGSVMVVKQAPILHKNKGDDKLIIGMLNQLTQKSIYGGKCKMTYDNDIRKAEFEKYEAEKVRKTKEFIDYWKDKKLERFNRQ